jgi:hypothetical protein
MIFSRLYLNMFMNILICGWMARSSWVDFDGGVDLVEDGFCSDPGRLGPGLIRGEGVDRDVRPTFRAESYDRHQDAALPVVRPDHVGSRVSGMCGVQPCGVGHTEAQPLEGPRRYVQGLKRVETLLLDAVDEVPDDSSPGGWNGPNPMV